MSFAPSPVSAASPPAPMRPVRAGFSFAALAGRPVVAALLIVAAVFIVYAPALNGDFLWDDQALVRNNLLIRSPLFVLEAFRHTLFDNNSNFYRPIQTLVFIFDYWAWEMNPFGYHLVSTIIHALNGALLFLVLRRVIAAVCGRGQRSAGDEIAALAVAFIWAVHPVHSAAVAYISGSADSLAMMFCLGAWLACERAFETGSRIDATIAFLSFAVGLCCKEIACIWLALFLGYVLFVRTSLPRRTKILAAAGGLVAVTLYLALRRLPPPPIPPPPYPPLPSRWLLMIRALGDYGGLMIFPYQLFMERQVFAAPGLANPADDAVYFALGAAGIAVFASFVVGAIAPGRGRALRRFGAAWFLLAFLPISNLFTLNASVAEHWLYLPSIGFLLFLAGAVADIPWRGRKILARHAALFAMAAVVLLGTRTYRRSFDWLNEFTFFRQTIADGGDVPRARLGLANSLSHMQDDAAAIPRLREIATAYPKALSARINLANALARQGQYPEARAILQKVAKDMFTGNDPHQVTATVASLDKLDDSPGWPSERQALLAEATRHYPDAWELVQVRLQDCERVGDLPGALDVIDRYAQSHWWHAPAHFALGSVYSEMGRNENAINAWLNAARLDIHDPEALSAAAEACAKSNRVNEGCEYQRRAVDRQPSSPKQHALYAERLEQKGDRAGAAEQMAIANRLLAQGGR